MKAFLLVILLMASTLSWAQQQITTFILVRHAEKVMDGSENPELTPAGEARAKKLAELLEKTSVTAIYSTSFTRTVNTVGPLASAKHLEVMRYQPLKEAELDKMLKLHAGGTIVVTGHTNTTPWTANLLTGTQRYQEFDESDYSNILIVSVVSKGKVASVTWLRY